MEESRGLPVNPGNEEGESYSMEYGHQIPWPSNYNGVCKSVCQDVSLEESEAGQAGLATFMRCFSAVRRMSRTAKSAFTA